MTNSHITATQLLNQAQQSLVEHRTELLQKQMLQHRHALKEPDDSIEALHRNKIAEFGMIKNIMDVLQKVLSAVNILNGGEKCLETAPLTTTQ